MKIRDNLTGQVFNYGENGHHALRISKNGGFLTFENLQNGDGSLENGCGGYSFVLDDGKTPEESSSKDAVYGMTYANVGGFQTGSLEKILHEIDVIKESHREKGFNLEKNTFVEIVPYSKADIEYAKVKALSEALDIIKKHLSDNDDKKCSDCSRRKFYQAGYKDGKKKNDDWILVNPDNLPETEVLCCDKYGEMLIGYLSNTEEGYICESDGCVMYDVIAWMYKPEAYKPHTK